MSRQLDRYLQRWETKLWGCIEEEAGPIFFFSISRDAETTPDIQHVHSSKQHNSLKRNSFTIVLGSEYCFNGTRQAAGYRD